MKVAKVDLRPEGPALSRLVAGTMTWGEWGQDYGPDRMAELIQRCLEHGISTFDHADIYGHYSTEATFGAALAQLGTRVRAQVQLVTKCGINLKTHRRPDYRVKAYDSSPDHIRASVERSLENFRTDYLDLLLLHRPDPLLEPAAVAATFHELRAAGKVLHFGVSNFTPTQFALLNAHYPLVTNQVEASPLHPAPLFDGTFDQCMQLGIRPMVWSPLGGRKYFKGDGTGVLRLRAAVRTVAKRYGGVGEEVVLLAWLLRHPAGPLPVLGTTKPERLVSALAAQELQLDRQEWFEILEAARGHEVA